MIPKDVETSNKIKTANRKLTNYLTLPLKLEYKYSSCPACYTSTREL